MVEDIKNTRYGIPQKCLRKLLHGWKYLGGKQRAALGTVDDPEVIEGDTKEEQTEEQTGTKHERKEDEDDAD